MFFLVAPPRHLPPVRFDFPDSEPPTLPPSFLQKAHDAPFFEISLLARIRGCVSRAARSKPSGKYGPEADPKGPQRPLFSRRGKGRVGWLRGQRGRRRVERSPALEKQASARSAGRSGAASKCLKRPQILAKTPFSRTCLQSSTWNTSW